MALACLASSALGAMAETRLWVSEALTNGNIGGRDGADAFCASDANKPQIRGATTIAFLSISASDEIRDMPSNYGVPEDEVIYRADGTTQIAENFAALLNASLDTPLLNSVSEQITRDLVWTGSTTSGETAAPNNCVGFTSEATDIAVLGRVGSPSVISVSPLSTANSTCSGANRALYCLSFTPVPEDAPVPPGVGGSATGLEW